MGFQNLNKKAPNRLWKLLLDFAEAKGALNWDSKERSENWTLKDFQRLRRALKAYFGLAEDPITSYDKRRGYQTTFKILYDHTIDPE